jgi:ADP-heptose:LPS heptosyltransferase
MMALLRERPIERIAVFRALMLGDLLCAVPALRALRAGFPQAQITLIGLPWAAGLARRLGHVDDFIGFPGYPGLPEVEPDVAALPGFFAEVQARKFDLAVQLHGSGEISNPLVVAFGAQRNAGFAGPYAWWPGRDAALFAPWPRSGNEIERLLGLVDHLELTRRGLQLEFPLKWSDRNDLCEIWAAASEGVRYVCVHAGAQLASRRWGTQRFAAVADAIAEQGRTVVLTGSATETGLVAEVQAHMRRTPVNLCGRTTLWTLGALIEGAEAVICNDTGISHIAAALCRPSVVVSCGSDSQRWAPLDWMRHRVLAHDVPCRPCDYRVCPIGHDCAAGTTVQQVLEAYAASPASSLRSISAVASRSATRLS